MVSIYKLARLILPKKLQSILGNRHKVFRYTIDQLLYKFPAAHPTAECLHQRFTTSDIIPTGLLEHNEHIQPTMRENYRNWYSYKKREESVYRVTDGIWIEPRSGWPMDDCRTLYLSLYTNGVSNFMPTPDYMGIIRRKPVVEFDKILSLRDTTEYGYSHFYTDILAKMELAIKHISNPQDYTLILGKKVGNVPSMQSLVEHYPPFKLFAGIFYQDNEYVKAKEAIMINSLPNATGSDVFIAMIENAKKVINPADTVRDDRLFVMRGPSAKRQLRNQQEIIEILKPYGFEAIDPGEMTLAEQIERFSNCRHMVGIHGAGLTNIIFRYPHKFSLFEMMEPSGSGLPQNPIHHSFCTKLGFDYAVQVGADRNPRDFSFVMPAKQFETSFKEFWQAQQSG